MTSNAMTTTISPLAPANFPDMPPIDGVRIATAAAGIRYTGRTDVLLALFDPGTTVAGVLTRSKCPSAPVDWCRAHLKGGERRRARRQFGQRQCLHRQVRPGGDRAHRQARRRSGRLRPRDVFLASTGVIGEPLDASKFGGVMGELTANAAPGKWHEAANAIMTTDTFPKGAAAIVRLGATPVTICGIAKGAGMIAPDMATMLAFVFTDAPISARILQGLLKDGVADTFNAVTIDGDTSTSDTLLAFATGAAAARGVAEDHAGVRPPARRLPQGVRRRAGQSRRAGRPRRRGRAQAGRGRGRRRGVEGARPARSRSRSPTRRW